MPDGRNRVTAVGFRAERSQNPILGGGHLYLLGPAGGRIARASNMPGVLVEGLFLTNPDDAALAADPATQAQFQAAIRAAAVFLAGRERTKTTIIKLVHEARLNFHEIGRRMLDAGHFERIEDFALLTNEEYDSFLKDPGSYASIIADRRALFDTLQQVEPPFIVAGEVPPLDTWTRRGDDAPARSQAGDVLSGIAGCPGTYTGRARVVLSPHEPGDLEPPVGGLFLSLLLGSHGVALLGAIGP